MAVLGQQHPATKAMVTPMGQDDFEGDFALLKVQGTAVAAVLGDGWVGVDFGQGGEIG